MDLYHWAMPALTYPTVFLGVNFALPSSNVIPGIIWGLATALLPWLVLFPGFGWGFFGKRSPRNVRPLLAPALEHSVYGLGVGLILTITFELW